MLGRVVWDSSNGGTEADDFGRILYNDLFEQVIELTEVRRVDDIPEAVRFLELMDRLRDGECTEEDWNLVCRTCSKSTMTSVEWNERFGDDVDDVTYLFNTNKEVNQYNNKRLTQLGKPIALIEAEHTGKSKSMSSDNFMGLACGLFLSVCAKVVMTSNVCLPAGLCKRTVGTVKDIIYKEGEAPPSLPWFVLVDFGDAYTGPDFFPDRDDRKGWVPVQPYTSTEWTASGSSAGTGVTEHSRTMLPLKLAWAWTTWKVQGQTIRGMLVADLGSKENEHGLSYTAFSRVTRLFNFGIIGGLTLERFTSKIKNQAKVAPRRVEESRLRTLAAATTARLLEEAEMARLRDE